MSETWDEYCAENDLTRLLDVIRRDGGDAPGCHWGTRSWMFERPAVALALVFEDASGDDYSDPDLMDGVMSQIVNDSEGRMAYTIINGRHALPADFFDWLEYEEFTDSDEQLEKIISYLQRMANGWAADRRVWCVAVVADPDRRAPWKTLCDLAWEAIFDYWDNKEA